MAGETWHSYVDWGQRDRAVWWLVQCKGYTRRAAEARVAHYENGSR